MCSWFCLCKLSNDTVKQTWEDTKWKETLSVRASLYFIYEPISGIGAVKVSKKASLDVYLLCAGNLVKGYNFKSLSFLFVD